jgi:HTH-type transcriptional regulator/antitoxin HigA
MPDAQEFRPTWVSPPGDTISDVLSNADITETAFAERIGSSPMVARDLLRGRIFLTPDLALKLEEVLGGSAAFWLNRERQYREGLANARPTTQQPDDVNWIREIPVRDMISFGWIPPARSQAERLRECLRFFGVPDAKAWRESYRGLLEVVAFRTSHAFESRPAAVAAWLRRAEMEAAEIEAKPWNRALFRAILPELRSLSRRRDPARFLPELKARCAECGLAVAVVPAPAGCRASGASKFLSPEKALVVLSFRHRSDDHFWFTFFHEAGHLLLHNQDAIFVDGVDMMSTHEEEEADAFAAECLIPVRLEGDLLGVGRKYKDVIRFARRAGISPGIVVGQLQHRGVLKRNELNFLKTRFSWVSERD